MKETAGMSYDDLKDAVWMVLCGRIGGIGRCHWELGSDGGMKETI